MNEIITPGRWDTIALLGMAPSSRKLIMDVPETTAIFGIAACQLLEAKGEIPRPMDACVEIHPRWWLAHPNYAPDLYAWLHEPHPFPIFTHEYQPDWPASVAYPLDEMAVRFGAGQVRGDKLFRFFTSSLDYLIALALAYEPKRIELYGYDMGTDTEYRYQREGASFWLGVARGLGVEVWLPENCPMLRSDLYGFEGAQRVPLTYLAELQEVEEARAEKVRAEFQQMAANAPNGHALEDPDKERAEYFERLGHLRDMHYIHSGAAQALAQLRTDYNVDDIINRQELERQATMIQLDKNRHLSNLNWHEGIVQDRRSRWKANPAVEQFRVEFEEAYNQQQHARDTHFVFEGGLQVLQHLIAKCDLQPGGYEPKYYVLAMDVPGNDTEPREAPQNVNGAVGPEHLTNPSK